MRAGPPTAGAGGSGPPDPVRVRAWADAYYGTLLRSPCAADRVLGIERWETALGDPADVVPLLADDAPVIRRHAGRDRLVEVRADALVALQDRYRAAAAPWPHGPVTVRRAMPVDEAHRAALALASRPDAAAREAAAAAWVDARVQPPPADRAACLAYGLLRAAGALGSEVQTVRPGDLLTPLQEAVHASQVAVAPPGPHVRFDAAPGDPRPVGRLRWADGWRLTADEGPAGRTLDRLLAAVLREVGPPHDADDVPARLRAVAAAVSRVRPARYVDDA